MDDELLHLNCGGPGGKPGPCPGPDDSQESHHVAAGQAAKQAHGASEQAISKSAFKKLADKAHEASGKALSKSAKATSGNDWSHRYAEEAHKNAASAHLDAYYKHEDSGRSPEGMKLHREAADEHTKAAGHHYYAQKKGGQTRPTRNESYVETIATNAGHTRRETLDGRSYLVAPMTILKEGVLAGSQGALYYPAGEIAKNPGVWNHVPLTIYHPTDDNGNPTSARSPSVISKYGVGYVFNDRYDPATNTRHAEAWFDEQKLQQVENRFAESKRSYDPVLPRLLSGQPVELSTGLFTQNDLAANGSHYNGKSYTHVARDYRPDHLAVLPDQIGACSLKDGCGVLRNELCENCGGKGGKPGPCPTGISQDSSPHSPGQKVRFNGGIFAGQSAKVVKSTAEGVLVKFPKKKGVEGAEFLIPHKSDKPTMTTTRHITTNSEITMNKDEAIQHLTANCDCWKNKQDVLANLDEDVVVDMAQKDQELAQNRLVVNAVKERFGDIAVNAMPEAIAKAKMPPPAMEPDGDEEDDEEIPAPKKKGPPVAPAMNNFTDFLKLPPEQRMTENERRAIAFANGIEAKYRADLLDFVVNAVSSDKASAKAVRVIYEKMTTNELETLKGTIPQRPVGSVERQAEMPLINWMGSGFGGTVAPTTNRIDEDDVLVLPK